jgi:hypothetical protein
VRAPDPKGGGHGWPPFSDRAMDGEYENPEGYSGRRIDLSKVVSFGDFSLDQQRKSLS